MCHMEHQRFVIFRLLGVRGLEAVHRLGAVWGRVFSQTSLGFKMFNFFRPKEIEL